MYLWKEIPTQHLIGGHLSTWNGNLDNTYRCLVKIKVFPRSFPRFWENIRLDCSISAKCPNVEETLNHTLWCTVCIAHMLKIDLKCVKLVQNESVEIVPECYIVVLFYKSKSGSTLICPRCDWALSGIDLWVNRYECDQTYYRIL